MLKTTRRGLLAALTAMITGVSQGASNHVSRVRERVRSFVTGDCLAGTDIIVEEFIGTSMPYARYVRSEAQVLIECGEPVTWSNHGMGIRQVQVGLAIDAIVLSSTGIGPGRYGWVRHTGAFTNTVDRAVVHFTKGRFKKSPLREIEG